MVAHLHGGATSFAQPHCAHDNAFCPIPCMAMPLLSLETPNHLIFVSVIKLPILICYLAIEVVCTNF